MSIEARNEVFRLVGRNIANFQILESALREFIPKLTFGGTAIGSKKQLAQRAKGLRKRTLGTLLDEFKGEIFRPDADVESGPVSETEISFHHKFRIDASPEFAKDFKKKFTALVAERNDLVHSSLVGRDLNSAEECANLIEFLNEQNRRIVAGISQISEIKATHAQVAALMASIIEEFLLKRCADPDAKDT